MRNLLRLSLLCVVSFTITSCVLDNPVSEVPEPSEFEYNYWLLSHWYLNPEELHEPDFYDGQVNALYNELSDSYTRYIPPSISQEVEQEINSSVVLGDIGIETLLNKKSEFPLFIYRVYPSSPAAKAGIERYSTIISINDVSLNIEDAYEVYQKEFSGHKEIKLVVLKDNAFHTFSVIKEMVYAPTVFLDTISGIPFISIESFKPNTWDQVNGSFGEMKALLKETKTAPLRVLDLRNNLGGHIQQCIDMADLFVASGVLSSRSYKKIKADGTTGDFKTVSFATPGGEGEDGEFLLFVNQNTASCAEIFTAAVAENRKFIIVGEKTYGKGVGQNTWKTKNNGLAIITSMVFGTPNGSIYNGYGIQPDILCEKASHACLFDFIQKKYAIQLKKSPDYDLNYILPTRLFSSRNFGGAIIKQEILNENK